MPADLSAKNLAAQSGGYEPQRQSNWEFAVALANQELIKLSAVTFTLPNESSEDVALPYGNETRYVAGKTMFDQATLDLRDFVDKDTRKAIVDWRKEVYDPDSGRIGLARDYKKDATLTLYGPDGTMERKCKLQGCWPMAVNHGQADHSSSDVVLISVTLRYDIAKWEL
jgi:hypothetical protein